MMTDSEMLMYAAIIADKNDNEASRIDVQKIAQIKDAVRLLKKIASSQNVKVTSTLHYPYNSTGVVRVVGRELNVMAIKKFAEAVKLASTFDIYPLTTGDIQIELTFNGITCKIGER